MDGFHDLGGVQGFGAVDHKINSKSYKPVFKQEWEHLAYTLMFVGAAHLNKFNIDQVRHAVERINLRQHVGTQYYERYVIATATLLTEAGVITQEELNEALGSHFQLATPHHSNGRAAIGGREPFNVGDKVTVRDEHIAGHTRAPAYARGKTGVVVHRTKEEWPFPDAAGHGHTDALHQPSYHVEFSTKELWNDAADEGYVIVDLFESYLDKAIS